MRRASTLADLTTEPSPRSPALDYAREAIVDSTLRAPLHPAGHDDSRAHLLLRMIMEDIAASPMPSTSTEADRLWALGELDGLPVAARTELGHSLLAFMDRVAALSGEGFFTETRTVLPNPGEFSPMVFMVASESSEEARQALFLKTQLTHYNYYEATTIPGGSTMGIMLAPSSHPSRIWDTSMSAAQGDQGHSPDDITQLRTYLAQQTDVHRLTHPNSSRSSTASSDAFRMLPTGHASLALAMRPTRELPARSITQCGEFSPKGVSEGAPSSARLRVGCGMTLGRRAGPGAAVDLRLVVV